jgi:hypothetical protein
MPEIKKFVPREAPKPADKPRTEPKVAHAGHHAWRMFSAGLVIGVMFGAIGAFWTYDTAVKNTLETANQMAIQSDIARRVAEGVER